MPPNSQVVRPQVGVPYFLRKISPKTITEAIGEINLLELQRPVQARHLYDVYGQIRIATLIPDKSGQRKDSVRFAGKFKALTQDGYVFESGRMFIPVMEEMMYCALTDAQLIDKGAYIEIALSVGIMTAPAGKPSATGYEFDVQRLIQKAPTPDDPIERLIAEAMAQRKLAAPTPVPSSDPSASPISNGSAQGEPSPDTANSSAAAPESHPKPSRRGSHASA